MNDTDVTTDATKYHNTIEPRDDYPSHLRPLPEGYVYVGTGAGIPTSPGGATPYCKWDSRESTFREGFNGGGYLLSLRPAKRLSAVELGG